MRQSALARNRDALTRPEAIGVCNWAAGDVDFSRVPAYDTPYHGRYDPDLMPYWREPAENLLDPTVRETWCLKAARAGASENVLLTALRYIIAREPQAALFLSGDQKASERFFERRIKLGLEASEECAAKWARATIHEHEVYFPDMDLTVTWPRSKTAFKQSGYAAVFGDEVSIWPDYSVDMLRKRCDTYAFAHIFGVSSMDPTAKRATEDDPIWRGWIEGDQRYWMMPDPGHKDAAFRWEMGSPETTYGLKWDKDAKRDDGTWDYKRVAATAHYMTPGGARIENAKRLAVTAKGRWVPTNAEGSPGVRSYHLNSFHLPFGAGDFGAIAVAFLKAKRGGATTLKTFVYEVLAEEWKENYLLAHEGAVYARQGDYGKGEVVTAETPAYKDKLPAERPAMTFVTVDVQQKSLWYVARKWWEGGPSLLLDWGNVTTFDQIEEAAEKYKAERVMVDCGYRKRQLEVYEYALRCQAWPTEGSGTLTGPAFKQQSRNVYEGIRNSDDAIAVFTFQPDIFKSLLLDMIEGQSPIGWEVYRKIEPEYVTQVTSEECVDGVWQIRRHYRDNHLWDCEVLQLLAARLHRLLRHDILDGGLDDG